MNNLKLVPFCEHEFITTCFELQLKHFWGAHSFLVEAPICKSSIGVGIGGGTGGMCPPSFYKLLYKLLTTICVISNCAPRPPNQKSLSYTYMQSITPGFVN